MILVINVHALIEENQDQEIIRRNLNSTIGYESEYMPTREKYSLHEESKAPLNKMVSSTYLEYWNMHKGT